MSSDEAFSKPSAAETSPVQPTGVWSAPPWTDPRTWFLGCLAFVAVCVVLYLGRAILMPAVVAVILSFLLNPIVRRMNQWWIPSWLGAGLVLAFGLALAIAAGYSLSGPAAQWLNSAPSNIQQIEAKLRSLQISMRVFGDATDSLEKIASIGAEEDDAVVRVRQRESGLAAFMLNWTGNTLLGLSVVAVLTYFLLASRDQTRRNLVSISSSWRVRRGLLDTAQEIEHNISLYLVSYTVINTCLGILIGATMWLLGMPNPMLWGVMAGVLNFAPYIGPAIGAVVVALVSIVTFDLTWYALLPPLCYFGWNALEGNFLTPAILGRVMHLTPLSVVLSLLFWGWLWGPMGVLLAAPMLTIGAIAARRLRDFVRMEQHQTAPPPPVAPAPEPVAAG